MEKKKKVHNRRGLIAKSVFGHFQETKKMQAEPMVHPGQQGEPGVMFGKTQKGSSVTKKYFGMKIITKSPCQISWIHKRTAGETRSRPNKGFPYGGVKQGGNKSLPYSIVTRMTVLYERKSKRVK